VALETIVSIKPLVAEYVTVARLDDGTVRTFTSYSGGQQQDDLHGATMDLLVAALKHVEAERAALWAERKTQDLEP
jgi:hypothetical protein